MNKPTQSHDIGNDENMSPRDIVKALDKHIIGQKNAKKAVAIAIRNRWRRSQLKTLKNEVTPKNILMIGPTGVGKTEISRRMATLLQAPFIKVEATKFTEVGYVGRDVETIIRDLVAHAIAMLKDKVINEIKEQVQNDVEAIIIAALTEQEEKKDTDDSAHSKQKLIKDLESGMLDEKSIEIDIKNNIGIEIMTANGMEDIGGQIQNLFQNLPVEKNKKVMKIADARNILFNEHIQTHINEEQIKQDAIAMVEESGIVFLDEIDKVLKGSGHSGDVSREGVQRDLLPLIEGSNVQTKYGTVKTDHILFIASGAFLSTKPQDMISELQGRLPIRVELEPLTMNDYKRILTEPQASLIKQYTALMDVENVKLSFCEKSIEKIAEITHSYNERFENIGARRLHTIMEKLLEEVSFDCQDYSGKTFHIDQDYVSKQLKFKQSDDMAHWIL